MKSKAQERSEDRRTDKMISRLLRSGVMLSSAFVLVAGLFYLAANGRLRPDYHEFRSEPANLRGLFGILRELSKPDPRNWMQFGLVLLVATPVARVALCVVTFVKEKDRTYVVLTLIVLAVLIFGLTGR